MNRVEALLLMVLLTLAFGAGPARGDDTPKAKDLVGTVQEARKLSDVYYYYELGAPCNRRFVLDRNGSVSVIPYAGRLRLVNDEGHVLNLPDKAARVRGAELYRGVLKDLRGDRRKDKKLPAPLDLLHIEYVVGDAPDVGYVANRRAVRKGYLTNPSSLIALVYLEDALVEKELGQPVRYRELVHEAVARLELAGMTYQADVRFRVRLREALNFARPEACLLFLVAEDDRLGKRAPKAIRGYTTLIERAPGSPFAWEALAKLSVMPKVDPKEIGRLSGLLLETYPLIWGCPRPDLKMKKEEFATQLPALLQRVGRMEGSGAQDPFKLIQLARKRSGETYYFRLHPYGFTCRRFFVIAGGQLRCQISKPSLVWLKVSTVGSRSQALLGYRKLLVDLKKARKKGKEVAAPVSLLHQRAILSDFRWDQDQYDYHKVKKGYDSNPSSLSSVVYLELALLENRTGPTKTSMRLIREAVTELKLMEMDYRNDVRFRRHLLYFWNFARPEACLLFLVAEDARLGKRAPEAIRGYTTLIERAPGSPFAWEALAKLSVMPKVDPKEISRLSGLLLETYPLIWGCPRPDLKIKKEEFATQLPALLKKVGQEEAGKR